MVSGPDDAGLAIAGRDGEWAVERAAEDLAKTMKLFFPSCACLLGVER